MIKILGKLPEKCTVAFSGGVDSVAVVDFLLRSRRVDLAFFNHNTVASAEAEIFVSEFANKRSLKLTRGKLDFAPPKGQSLEDFWREHRYNFLSTIDGPVITAHHLDDSVETWIFTSLRGNGKIIPYKRGNVIRPFLMTPKSEFMSWCKRQNLSWCEDASNNDVRFMRNLIRKDIVPAALIVNPGLRSVIRKKYLAEIVS